MKHLALALVLLATTAFAGDKHVVVVIGDSIAAGGGVDSSRHTFTYRLQSASHGDWFFLNVSRPGATIAGVGFPGVQPGLIGMYGVTGTDALFMLGINDYMAAAPIGDVTAKYDALLGAADFWGLRITCVTPLWMQGEERKANAIGLTVEDYRDAIRRMCAWRRGTVIEGLDLIPHDTSLYSDGWLHPNDRGHTYLAKRLYVALRAAGW